jgi:GDPmannose 4,6-dehydratase
MKSIKKKCVIIGANGQDGKLLTSYLRNIGYDLILIDRIFMFNDGSNSHFSILSSSDVYDLIKNQPIDKIFYLAAYHESSEDKSDECDVRNFNKYNEVNSLGLLNFLHAIKFYKKNIKLFYASSSLIFDGNNITIQDEKTSYNPEGFYGMTKLLGMELCKLFRERYNIWVTTGILYSHESIYRSNNFLSKKLLNAAYEISIGIKREVIVGDLSVVNDWGYAADYVKAMHLALEAAPEDFIIATGEAHSVSEFASEIFESFGLDYKRYIKENKTLLTRINKIRIGNYSKINKMTSWRPSYNFKDMVNRLKIDYLDSIKN